MDRKYRFSAKNINLRLGLLWAFFALIAISISGCSIGPVNLGGSPTSNTPSTSSTPLSGNAIPVKPTAPPPTPTTVAARQVSGKVLDAYTGQPVANAEVTGGSILTGTTSDGSFFFDMLPITAKVSAKADGYAPGEVAASQSSTITVKLRPSTLSGRVTDATTGKPLVEVLVKLVLPAEVPSPKSQVPGPSVPVTATVVATATIPTTTTFGIWKGLAAPLAVATPSASSAGEPTDEAAPTKVLPTSTPVPPTATPTPKPIPPTGPGFVAVYTDENGSFFFKDVPENANLTFKMPGYKLAKMPVGETSHKDVALEQFKPEAIYITAPVASTKSMYNQLLQFVDTSRINAVVLNVQNDNSEWVYDTKNKDAIAAGNTDIFLENMPALVKSLRDKGIYTIARFVTFQQPTMAKARPDLAVKSSVTGKVWLGGQLNQQAWLDATNPAAQDYLIDMTKEVLSLGFDEIQYDYVRFPSDPAPKEPGKPVYSRPITDTDKALAIQSFVKKAHDVIEPTDAFMSIDIFGYSLWPDRNGKPLNGVIGQVFEYLVDNTDYICPMIYPSHFSPGEQGCPLPENCAYKMVLKSGEFAQMRFDGKRAKYRPWLEDFDWYNSDYTSPGTTKVAEQMQAAKETDAWGWQWWDAANEYQPRAAFKK